MHFALVRTSALSEFNRLTWPAANPFYVGRPMQQTSAPVSVRIGRAAYVLLTRLVSMGAHRPRITVFSRRELIHPRVEAPTRERNY